MTWCDKLASQPTVGFLVDPHFAGGEVVLSSLTPLLNKWGSVEIPEFAIAHPDVLAVQIQHNNGFTYTLDQNKVALQFQHRIRYRSKSGALPESEITSQSKIYSEMLDDSLEKLMEVSKFIPAVKSRSIHRIGIVSHTVVSDDDLPPGISRFIEHISNPWKSGVIGLNLTLTSLLRESPAGVDRCIHQIVRSEDEDGLLTLRFDWQRYLPKAVPIEQRDMEKLCGSAKAAALEYFEELAVGNAFDAHDNAFE